MEYIIQRLAPEQLYINGVETGYSISDLIQLRSFCFDSIKNIYTQHLTSIEQFQTTSIIVGRYLNLTKKWSEIESLLGVLIKIMNGPTNDEDAAFLKSMGDFKTSGSTLFDQLEACVSFAEHPGEETAYVKNIRLLFNSFETAYRTFIEKFQQAQESADKTDQPGIVRDGRPSVSQSKEMIGVLKRVIDFLENSPPNR
jgi:hypothetical protein